MTLEKGTNTDWKRHEGILIPQHADLCVCVCNVKPACESEVDKAISLRQSCDYIVLH